MTAESVLTCADCEGELAMLRVTKAILRLGHVKEPKELHVPRLSPAARNDGNALPSTGQPEAADTRRGLVAVPDASPRRMRGTRAESDGQSRSRNAPSGTSSSDGSARRGGGSPALTPRAPVSVGKRSSTAGEAG